MVRDHCDPTSASQQAQGSIKGCVERSQLVVDRDAESLKGASCWVPVVAGPSRHGPGDDLREVRGVADGAGGNDGACNPAGEVLFTEPPDDAGEVGDDELIDEVPGIEPGVRAHAHVERAGAPIGEASLPQVELVRRDTEVENGAIEFIGSLLGHYGFQIPKVRPMQRHPRQSHRGRGGIRVPIDGNDAQRRHRRQQRPGVPSPTEGGVEDDLRMHRSDRLHHPVDEHRDVIGRAFSAHGQPPGTLAPHWNRAE